MIIAELMTQPVRACGPADTLQAAAQIMWDEDCGSVPVVSGDGQVVGMTHGDLLASQVRRRGGVSQIG